jgi:hypothetical protein
VHYTETPTAEFRPLIGITLPPNYVPISSNKSTATKDAAYQRFQLIWKNSNLPPLTPVQLKKLRNDVYVIFEASSAMFDTASSWKLGMTSFPVLYTFNIHLCRKLLSSPARQDVLEEVINLSGFEHLIEVVPLV